MSTDEDLGRWLRQELVRHESRQAPAPGLVPEALAAARRTERRRSWVVAVGAAASALAVVAVAVVIDSAGRPDHDDPPPAGSTSGTTQTPSESTESSPSLTAGAWAATLPTGPPPDVAYADQQTLHLPTGPAVDLGSTDAEIIGDTVAGTVLLVEHDATDRGGAFRSWYVVVAPDGTVTRLDSDRNTRATVQEAVVSPDGRWFSNGRIFDMTTGQVTGALPAEADILLAWTPAGIVYETVYGAGGTGEAEFLWSPGGPAPIKLDGRPGGFPNGTDIGLKEDGCPTIVRLTAAGTEEELSRHCGIHPITVSPGGSWLLTKDLVAIDVATGEEHALADRPVDGLGYAWDAHWLDEDDVLLSVPAAGYQAGGEVAPDDSAILVRCHLAQATCERTTDPIPGVGSREMVSLP